MVNLLRRLGEPDRSINLLLCFRICDNREICETRETARTTRMQFSRLSFLSRLIAVCRDRKLLRGVIPGNTSRRRSNTSSVRAENIALSCQATIATWDGAGVSDQLAQTWNRMIEEFQRFQSTPIDCFSMLRLYNSTRTGD
jgi:hypothetical protein